MQLANLIFYLESLGNELEALGFGSKQNPKVEILLVGGAALMVYGYRTSTNDVDVVIDRQRNGLIMAARVVSRTQGIPPTWLNDVISDFLRDQNTVPRGTFWKTFGALDIYLAPLDYLLATKLLANRDKDANDIRVLIQKCRISSRARAQALIDLYFPNKQLQLLEEVPATLEIYFP